MARESRTETFDTSAGALAFTITQLGGITAARLAIRLGKIIAPAAAKAPSIKNGDSNGLSDAVTVLVERLTPEEFEAVALELLRKAAVQTDGGIKPMTKELLEELFAGHLSPLVKLLKFALEVNFGSFFDDLATLFASASKPASNPPPIPVSFGQQNA